MTSKSPRNKDPLGGMLVIGFTMAAMGTGIALLASSMIQGPKLEPTTYSQYFNAAATGRVKNAIIAGCTVAYGEQGYQYTTYAPQPCQLNTYAPLRNTDATVTVLPATKRRDGLVDMVVDVASSLIAPLIFGLFLIGMRRGVKNTLSGLTESRARMAPLHGRKTFADVAGYHAEKADLEDIVDYLRNPERYTQLGGRIPRGVLLEGPAGTGKTLIARALAGEAGVPFFYTSGSDFVEIYVGVGAGRVRSMFDIAGKSQPCIIFIDEIDSIAGRRSHRPAGANDEREQTLNQILVELDGMEDRGNVILIAATNRADALDPAILRAGRLDRRILIPKPDVATREAILRLHLSKLPHQSVDAARLASQTPGLTGADLMNLVNEMALLAARKGDHAVEERHADAARDAALMGRLKTSTVLSDDDRRRIAVREGARALTMALLPHLDPLHKVSILTHGQREGMTLAVPVQDRVSQSMAEMQNMLITLCAGRVAEDMIYGAHKVSSTHHSDIALASNLARNMVTSWGMSPLGPVSLAPPAADGARFASQRLPQTCSDATAAAIDAEVRRMVGTAQARARILLAQNHDSLNAIIETLTAKETMTGAEIRATIRPQPSIA